MDAAERSQFPGFAVVERLYAGARSTVYRARSTGDGRDVVLKVANTSAAMIDEALARLRHEMAMLAQIRSDRVIRAIDAGRIGDDAVLVLEDAGGESLDRYLARARLSLGDALGLAIHVVAALGDVHAAGIIHKDVTPGNIVYDAASGRARLIDFDVATAWRTERHSFAMPRPLEGTPRYMAPEQTGRMNRVIDSRADLYAFGVTLFELLAGRVPFGDPDILSIVHAHLAVRPPALDTIDPAIPRPIAAIVGKLLAKAPEDRYQTAAGLLADLRICLERYARTGAIEDFPLGGSDVATRFELPTKLYGRRSELAALGRAFERAATGVVETVLVSGASGVGKTSVVRELFPLITRERGYYLSGKFDQLRGDAPYPALVAAFDGLIHQLLTESEDELARWRAQIVEAVAPNGQVVVDALPALDRIIGPQPPVFPLDAAGTQSRFHVTLQKFIQVFTRRAHPLVLFLDDVQWADPESLQLLAMVAMSEATEALLLVMAFRAGEIGDGHPLSTALRPLRAREQVTEIAIAPLALGDVAALLADTLHQGTAAVAPLAHLVRRKTDGNPFFMRQLLLALHEAGHIVFDHARGWFAFDAASIERSPISENVADLLAANLRKLPEATQRVLAIAAAIGNRFELDMVAMIAGHPITELHDELCAALREELVVPLSELTYLATPRGAGLVFPLLRFQHDRVQRAAYALMSPDEQQRMHLQIGELLLAGALDDPGDRLFDVVSHYNRAVQLLASPDQRGRLARLDVTAARRACSSAAYGAAIEFLRVAVDCFEWQAEYREQLDAHAMLAECYYLSGDTAHAAEVIEVAGAHASDRRDRATLETLRATLQVHVGDMAAAIQSTRRAAALLGRPLPGDAAALGPASEAAIHEILARIADRPVAPDLTILDLASPPIEDRIDALIELPVMTDLDSLALIAALRACLPAAFQLEPELGAYMTTQMVLLSLDHGNCAASAHAYVTLAGMLFGSHSGEVAYRFGKLGIDLNLRLGDRGSRAAVEFVFALYSAWRGPIEQAISYLVDARHHAREIGDHIHGGSAAALEIRYRLFYGAEPLPEICRDAMRYRQDCRNLGDRILARSLTAQIDRMRMMMGELDSWTSEDPGFETTLHAARASGNLSQQFAILHAMIDAAYAAGHDAAVLEIAAEIQQIEPSLPRMITVIDYRFWYTLSALATCRHAPDRRAELEPKIESNWRELARCAAMCPSSFEPMYLLVDAERRSSGGELAATLALYDRATTSATRHGRRRLEALANELHGRLWLDRGKPEIAQLYLTRARNQYAALGALRNVRALERKHPALVRTLDLRPGGTVTTNTAAEVLDVTAIAKATRAISGELELDRLFERMLDIILETAGAEAGALVLDDRRGLTMVASRTAGGAHTSTARTPIAVAELPRSILYYVQRTSGAVVIDDATADPRFFADDYVQRRAPRSVLCMPIKHQERAAGMLYLENTLVSGAFTQARLDALTILASQLAVSLENATLFAAQRVHAEAISRANQELRGEIAIREQAERELARYRDHLEELIAERTQELTLVNHKLRAAAAERERIEAELRLAQKLESVGRLAAGIAHEINTPVQFVSDNVTFVRDALPGLVTAISRYRALARSVATGRDVAAALDAARAADAAGDVDYALANTAPALDAARDGLGRVTAIVRSMKDFAHPDRDERTLVDLNRAIESTLVIAAHECKYIAEVYTELLPLPLVRCNAGEINQAVLNLVINAAHAIRDVVGNTGARGKIDVRTRLDGLDVEIAITDTGTGIPEAIRDKIYDPFFTTKEVGRGTGQGLAIVRSVVVDKHRGSVRFETAAGAGTTFFVRLPIGADADPCA